ncbi:hypothetical protein FS749_003483 [Ceratobasidium sp. UAMH 11750]|nr:hypothetical protein FS749_003483 [Ceratobasidium sp. UAMH 11750]
MPPPSELGFAQATQTGSKSSTGSIGVGTAGSSLAAGMIAYRIPCSTVTTLGWILGQGWDTGTLGTGGLIKEFVEQLLRIINSVSASVHCNGP